MAGRRRGLGLGPSSSRWGGIDARLVAKLPSEADTLGKSSFAFAFFMDRQKAGGGARARRDHLVHDEGVLHGQVALHGQPEAQAPARLSRMSRNCPATRCMARLAPTIAGRTTLRRRSCWAEPRSGAASAVDCGCASEETGPRSS